MTSAQVVETSVAANITVLFTGGLTLTRAITLKINPFPQRIKSSAIYLTFESLWMTRSNEKYQVVLSCVALFILPLKFKCKNIFPICTFLEVEDSKMTFIRAHSGETETFNCQTVTSQEYPMKPLRKI